MGTSSNNTFELGCATKQILSASQTSNALSLLSNSSANVKDPSMTKK